MRKFSLIFVVLALVASACSSGSSETAPATGERDPEVQLEPDEIRLLSGLVPFDDCNGLLEHLKSEARDRVGPYGLDWSGYYYFDDIALEEELAFEDDDAMEEASDDGGGDGAIAESDGETAAPAAAEESASDEAVSTSSEGGDSADGDVTGTNVQELGVDEPDLIKTDGDRVIIASQGQLIFVDISSGDPVETDRINIPEGWGHELFFLGDRVLLFTNADWGVVYPTEPIDVSVEDAEADFAESSDVIEPGGWYGPASVVMDIDISNPDDLQIDGTMRIQGSYLSARRVGNTVRMAITSPPSQLEWVYPQSSAGEERAERTNREIIEETTIEDWIPTYELTTDAGTEAGQLLDCDKLHRPAEFSGFDVVSVLSFDMSDGLDRGDGAGVLASGQTVYASTDRFYVATTEWVEPTVADGDAWEEWNESYSTDVHAFAISENEPATYVASGAVEGSLLNQFSMDEHDGHLRIITTDGSPWDEANQSETSLMVLREDGDVLVEVGRVGGIGKGETLFSARLLDDVGFAVTFRQIDPFYILDLSDPTNPQVTGELKIPGFSTYLHPIDENRVLGIGQDATDEGRTTGLKVSLFDVSDPTDPREVAVWTQPNANSPAEWDHRAFQYLPSQDIAIVPVTSWNGDLNGAVLLEIGDETITEIGDVTHEAPKAEPTSDCTAVDATAFTEETEFFWVAQEGGRIQVCDADDIGGYGSWYCDVIPVDDLRYWGPEEVISDVVRDLFDDASEGDRLELCWPDGGNWELQIQRSFVVSDTLWTMSQGQLQANALDGLAVIGAVTL